MASMPDLHTLTENLHKRTLGHSSGVEDLLHMGGSVSEDVAGKRTGGGARQTVSGLAQRERYLAAAASASAGVAFACQAVLDASGEVRYWRAETLIDYAAVLLYSVAFLFLGVALWAVRMFWSSTTSRAGTAARFGQTAVTFASVAAMVVSVSNFMEDFLALPWFGVLYMTGMIGFVLGMVCAGVARLLDGQGLRAMDGIILLAIAAGVLFISVTMLLPAGSLFALVVLYLLPFPRIRPPAPSP
ncbi:hypothetical protein [Paenarthrobacter ureafaciens]|uniref:hypothetical protein n=1 Tax=Paenarthrobacter ureafaciens TaxID=37931 RepID=UPI002DBA4DBB|nr:hypothetical protein [Paenarthrobacter ureafaciens]MEC3853071.1 hypothetical protein [Paenarthrobacter ureafaciens]